MKLLMDNGLPRSAASMMRDGGEAAVHVGEIGLSRADDDVILAHALEHDLVVVTLDGPKLVLILRQVMGRFKDELITGAVISVGPRNARCRLLPLR